MSTGFSRHSRSLTRRKHSVGRIGLSIADVSGKGVAAAFFMAVTRTMMRGEALAGLRPTECLRRVNERLCRENPVDMFVTALYAEFDPETGQLIVVNAGHCEPVVAGRDGKTRMLERAGNPPLGVIPNKQFAEKSFTLGEGEILVLYTDGVTEAYNRNGDLFKLQRLLDIAQQQCDRPPQEFMLAVIGGVDAFAAGAVQNDDITCLVIRRNASGAKLGAA